MSYAEQVQKLNELTIARCEAALPYGDCDDDYEEVIVCKECGEKNTDHYYLEREYICGLCPDCQEKLMTFENALAYDAKIAELLKPKYIDHAFIAECFTYDEAVKVLTDAAKERLKNDNGVADKFNEVAKHFVHGTDEESFIKFTLGEI